MKVFLKENVKDLGKAGDLVQVKEGFARNFLFPKNLACMATEKKVKEFKHLEKMAEIKRKKNETLLKKMMESLSEIKLHFRKATTSSGDRLFGSVTASEIAKELQKQNFEVNRTDVKTEPIKTLGEHKIPISFSKELSVDILITIEKQKEDKKQAKKKVRTEENLKLSQKQKESSEEESSQTESKNHTENKEENSPEPESSEDSSQKETSS